MWYKEHEEASEILCPYCGHELKTSYDFNEDGEHECARCKKEFYYSSEITITYSTTKKDE